MKFIKNLQRKTIIIGASILVAIIGIIVAIVLLIGSKNKEEKLENILKDLGTDFYENFYYNQVGTNEKERAEFLKKFKDIGIKVSLDNLFRYQKEEPKEIIAKFVNKETKKECDRINSMVIIYPKDPYGKTDYTIDSTLVCEDKEEDKNTNNNTDDNAKKEPEKKSESKK